MQTWNTDYGTDNYGMVWWMMYVRSTYFYPVGLAQVQSTGTKYMYVPVCACVVQNNVEWTNCWIFWWYGSGLWSINRLLYILYCTLSCIQGYICTPEYVCPVIYLSVVVYWSLTCFHPMSISTTVNCIIDTFPFEKESGMLFIWLLFLYYYYCCSCEARNSFI